MTEEQTALLEVENLRITFPGSREDGEIVALDQVDLEIRPGEIFGVIGETGAGKSLTAWAAINILPEKARIAAGAVKWRGRAISLQDEKEMRQILGSEISLIMQNPLAALNPMSTIGDQIVRIIRAHRSVSKAQAREIAIKELRRVGIPDPQQRFSAFPHQLSGGMAQRILIAMATVNRPKLLIADEPTTGLDVTIQAEILDLMVELVKESGTAIWLITHDLSVIANYAERSAVMFAGQIVESGPTKELFENPQHPYTKGFLEALLSDHQQGKRLDISGPPPNLAVRPSGCQFAYRCPWVRPDCRTAMPQLEPLASNHAVRCFVAHETAAAPESK